MSCVAVHRSFVVEWNAAVRDHQDRLIREAHDSLIVPGIRLVAETAVAIVQVYWPAATPADIQWFPALGDWDVLRELRWSTCAEIDGSVYRRDLMETPRG